MAKLHVSIKAPEYYYYFLKYSIAVSAEPVIKYVSDTIINFACFKAQTNSCLLIELYVYIQMHHIAETC